MSKESVQTRTPAYAWVILLVTFLASFSVPMNQFKVPPITPVLMQAFGFDVTTFGWLMTAFTVMGIVTAFPAAAIVNKFGNKKVTLAAVGCVIVGSVIGTFSAGNAAVMLFSRFVEGIGFGIFGIVAPAILVEWFPKKRLGLAVGVWSMWMPLGSTVMLNLAPALCGSGNWQAVWWAGTIFAVIAFVLFAVFYKHPTAEQVHMAGNDVHVKESSSAGEKAKIPRVAIVAMCIIGFAFMLDNITKNGSFNTYYPTFLQQVKGMDMGQAGLVTSVTTVLGALASPISGMVSDKLHDRKWMVVISTAMLFVSFIWAFAWETPMGMWAVVVIAGVFSSVLATVAVAAVPEIMGSSQKGQNFGLAIFSFANGVGSAIGSVALGYIVPVLGWATGSRVLFLPIIALALVLLIVAKWDNREAFSELNGIE